MASSVPSADKPTMGASIQPITSPNTSNPNLPTQQAPPNHPSTTPLLNTTSNTVTETETYDPTSTDPFSPFYCHTRASESKSRLHTRSSTAYDDHDLEKGLPPHTGITIHSVPSTQSVANNPNKPQGKCKQSLLCKSEAKKAQGWWRNLSKRQRSLVHVVIALLFVGAVTGLGVGVSKAMGTGVWKNSGEASKGIGQES
ncbi:MAG: hypothetical protein L6R40_000402 [Gallowayella cf. fulva]|nr:MAG: hypothetical protein L6R40_000402 [Xanthomendoza cf. fulva]